MTDRPPGMVTAANLALGVAAAAMTTDAVIGLRYARAVTDVFQRAYAEVPDTRFSIVSIITTSVILLVAAAGMLLLAYLNHRGRPAARIHTWILGAVVLCWGRPALNRDRGVPESVPDPAAFEAMLAAALPGWVEPVTTVTSMVTTAAVLAAILFLATPAAGQHFRPAPTVSFPD